MRAVIGYEAGATPDHPVIWGAAAIRTERGIHNACLGESSSIDLTTWKEVVQGKSATAMEVSVPVADMGPLFVVDLWIELLDREPYKVGDDELSQLMRGIVGVGRGKTRGYYIFKSHDDVTRWLYHLHAGPYFLIPVPK